MIISPSEASNSGDDSVCIPSDYVPETQMKMSSNLIEFPKITKSEIDYEMQLGIENSKPVKEEIGCDQSCNIGAVTIPIDTSKFTQNRETSKPSGLQINSNVNNNDIEVLDTLTAPPSNKFEPKIENEAPSLQHTLIEQAKFTNTIEVCSPRNIRTRSVETATIPKRNAKRALSADTDDKDIKLRKIDFIKPKHTPTKSEPKDEKSRSRRHDSAKKHDKKKSSSSRKKSIGTQTSVLPSLMTNGNYNFPPSEVSFSLILYLVITIKIILPLEHDLIIWKD